MHFNRTPNRVASVGEICFLASICHDQVGVLVPAVPLSSLVQIQALKELVKHTVAEREGFEPSVEVLPLRRFSKPLPSATRPPLP